MKKPWLYKRPDRPGWWVGWYDDTNRKKKKSFPTKILAEQFKVKKSYELNTQYHDPDEPQHKPWAEAVEEYRRHMEFKGRAEGSITRRMLALRTFQEMTGIRNTQQVTQLLVERYIIDYRKRTTRFGRPPSEATVYYELRHLKAFFKWASHKARRYIVAAMDLEQDQAPIWRKPRTLPDEQVRKLLGLFSDNRIVEHPDAWRIRILIAASAGLRKGDIEALTPAHFRPDRQSVETQEKKTGKWTERPLHPAVWKIVWDYVQSLPADAASLFPDTYTSKKWNRIKEAAGLPPGFRYHDLRVTFTSALNSQGVNSATTQKLLNHSTPRLTNSVYTDFDPSLRPAINQLPIEKWLGS